MRFKFHLFPLILLALICTQVRADDVRVSSRFNPTRLSVGQAGVYEIIVEGSQSAPSGKGIPGQQGLAMQYRGQQASFQIVNGRSSSRSIYIFNVIAQAPGSYTIAEYPVLVDGKTYTVPSATLEVSGSPSAVAASSYSAGQSMGSAPNRNPQAPSSPYVFLEIKLPRNNLYVGETIPCWTNLGVREGSPFRILSPGPEPIGAGFDAFAFNPAREPLQAREQRGPLVYRETLWPTAMTPLKAGAYNISFGLNVAVQVPTQPSGTEEDYASYSILSNFLANVETLSLETKTEQIQVKPLPNEGKPADFTGAIGSFSAQQLISTSTPEVGEPITLTLVINGTGNFDRIQAPAFGEDPNWKSYPPRVDFTPEDPIGYQGAKRIQYVIIPLNESIKSTPDLHLSYFDPVAGKYREITPEPLPLQVKAGSGNRPGGYSSSYSANGLSSPNTENALEDASLAPMPELGPIVDHIRPSFFTPGFWIAQIAIGVGLVGWFTLRRKQLRYLRDPRFAHRKHALNLLKIHWQMLANAAHTGNHARFLAEAQKIFQSVLSEAHEGQALTWEEIADRLSRRSASEGLKAMARELAEKSGSWQFGGGLAPNSAELKSIQDRIQPLLTDLKSLL